MSRLALGLAGPTSPSMVLHGALPREGPGLPRDVFWAAEVGWVGPEARICDAGCGSGGDIAALLNVAPRGSVTAIDREPHLVARAAEHWSEDPRVIVREGDLAEAGGPHDFIWCAGAIDDLGLARGLEVLRAGLAPGGVLAFSHPCHFVAAPSGAAERFWGAGQPVPDADAVEAAITAAGFRFHAARQLSDAAWEAYYCPLEERIAELAAEADAALKDVLDGARREAALWRQVRAETGYLLSVAVRA